MKTILILALLLSPASFAAAPKEGDKCTERVITHYEKNDAGYCFAEFLSCVSGRLMFIDGVHRPAPAANCGSKNKPKCPWKMQVRITVNETDSAKAAMEAMKNISEHLFDLDYSFARNGNYEVVPPYEITFKGTPRHESPYLWDTEEGRTNTREKVKEWLSKGIPGVEIDTCPGPLETPSVIGTN